jgi:hypothetical protein
MTLHTIPYPNLDQLNQIRGLQGVKFPAIRPKALHVAIAAGRMMRRTRESKSSAGDAKAPRQ